MGLHVKNCNKNTYIIRFSFEFTQDPPLIELFCLKILTEYDALFEKLGRTHKNDEGESVVPLLEAVMPFKQSSCSETGEVGDRQSG